MRSSIEFERHIPDRVDKSRDNLKHQIEFIFSSSFENLIKFNDLCTVVVSKSHSTWNRPECSWQPTHTHLPIDRMTIINICDAIFVRCERLCGCRFGYHQIWMLLLVLHRFLRKLQFVVCEHLCCSQFGLFHFATLGMNWWKIVTDADTQTLEHELHQPILWKKKWQSERFCWENWRQLTNQNVLQMMIVITKFRLWWSSKLCHKTGDKQHATECGRGGGDAVHKWNL